jgi:predicted metal-dependent phosphoesterase TrpH
VIDLHLHTTASDGKLRPSALVALAAQAGLRVISVTDHDTVAGLAEAREAAATHGVRLIDGIEITAIEGGRDVHVLGYAIDVNHAPLTRFLQAQRADRIDRVREIAERLRTLGCEIDVEAIIDRAASAAGSSVGRPLLADALIAAGHAVDRRDAFDRLLGNDKPGFVPRRGPGVERVAATIGEAGGLSSLAHPGLLGIDDQIPRFVASGIGALEARHREHDAAAEARYRTLARTLGVPVTGGSDFHGEPGTDLGVVTLPAEDFHVLEARLDAPRRRADASV